MIVRQCFVGAHAVTRPGCGGCGDNLKVEARAAHAAGVFRGEEVRRHG